MRKIKTPAQSLTDNFVDAVGRIWPTTIMNWDTKMNGKFVPWGYVKQALAAIDRGDLQSARAYLLRPMTTGLIGGPDVTGIIGRAPGAKVPPGTHVGWEIKAGSDSQRQEQKICQRAIEKHGAIYILVESVEQGIDHLKQYAGPGEK